MDTTTTPIHLTMSAKDWISGMEAMQFHALVEEFWRRKASVVSFSPSTTVFTCVLYDAFEFKCGLDGDHGTFTGGILSDSGRSITQFLGKRFSRNSDEASVLANLRLVDDYCRLRLPDKYLEAYDDGYGT